MYASLTRPIPGAAPPPVRPCCCCRRGKLPEKNRFEPANWEDLGVVDLAALVAICCHWEPPRWQERQDQLAEASASTRRAKRGIGFIVAVGGLSRGRLAGCSLASEEVDWGMDRPIFGVTGGSLGWEGKSWRLVPVGGAWLTYTRSCRKGNNVNSGSDDVMEMRVLFLLICARNPIW